jgi:4a-hydroxytetrahydrobiopterin dehydratase
MRQAIPDTIDAMTDLASRKCQSCAGGADRLGASRARELVGELRGWTLDDAARQISRTFEFKDFHQVMAFVNAVAWIAHREDHHPDLEVGFNRVGLRYTTHDAGGLTENDFICAAKVDRLL